MQIQKVQNNTNYKTSFNGTFRMYNYHKHRWFAKVTTPKEDKILSDFFDSFHLRFNESGFYNVYSRMENNDLLEYIKQFPKKSKGINLPKPSEELCAYVHYFNNPVGNRSSYEITANNTFKIIHAFDVLQIRKVND